jgi:hypothetical protein
MLSGSISVILFRYVPVYEHEYKLPLFVIIKERNVGVDEEE